MADLIALVRTRTTDDDEWLPDSVIQLLLDEHVNEWKMAAADALRYMARDDIYEQYQRGSIKVAKPLLMERANELVVEATTATGGISATSSSLVRGDYGTDTGSPEYSINHPPYATVPGFVQGLKKNAGY